MSTLSESAFRVLANPSHYNHQVQDREERRNDREQRRVESDITSTGNWRDRMRTMQRREASQVTTESIDSELQAPRGRGERGHDYGRGERHDYGRGERGHDYGRGERLDYGRGERGHDYGRGERREDHRHRHHEYTDEVSDVSERSRRYRDKVRDFVREELRHRISDSESMTDSNMDVEEMRYWKKTLSLEDEEIANGFNTMVIIFADMVETMMSDVMDFHTFETKDLSDRMQKAVDDGRFKSAVQHFCDSGNATFMKNPLYNAAATFVSVALRNHVDQKKGKVFTFGKRDKERKSKKESSKAKVRARKEKRDDLSYSESEKQSDSERHSGYVSSSHESHGSRRSHESRRSHDSRKSQGSHESRKSRKSQGSHESRGSQRSREDLPTRKRKRKSRPVKVPFDTRVSAYRSKPLHTYSDGESELSAPSEPSVSMSSEASLEHNERQRESQESRGIQRESQESRGVQRESQESRGVQRESKESRGIQRESQESRGVNKVKVGGIENKSVVDVDREMDLLLGQTKSEEIIEDPITGEERVSLETYDDEVTGMMDKLSRLTPKIRHINNGLLQQQGIRRARHELGPPPGLVFD
jgi:hypothetical protein